MAVKSKRLAEAIENLQAGALRAMRQSDESAARDLLQVWDHVLWLVSELTGLAWQQPAASHCCMSIYSPCYA